ncbi:MAG: ribonuclease III [Proteobacteria bacterium]|nr:ribonuclease III [Pseudomonadota bacterium]
MREPEPADISDLSDLMAALGHKFKQPALLQQALTHTSVTQRQGLRGQSNERLEFLGDRVLGLVIAELLLNRFPDENEGSIAPRHTALVRREALARVARKIKLGSYLMIDRGEEVSGGRSNPGMLANACEAVIAALYLDGGLAVAKKFIETRWTDMLEETQAPPRDDKTTLQEWAQGRKLDIPNYREIDRSGPDHAPLFTVEVEVVGFPSMQATGPSKRAAEQAAAAIMLEKVKSLGD